ncbi:14 kDa subunit of cytochrome bd ubiquinol oxidase [Coccomyxa subellipsoidea C-169]|uniref:Cytochrome b-c1 complex subunit 7 n=1 Tax=Coccomyxa subellipsoidea (strain C-169) TaxID=574566 RepID=I0YRA1_COCSC|nr:14 kDa subunit of cytochrome bd ubiquinol oxidase [Coccomyxa subellipsoidea C-169]EIE20920.1 14 kDa subunit of cytochrome bd ubiquinol oxidase [Coccomyxa subellipsoidea C-169]|eukprot:XP_005645464.1 14 kDa subunit of cytochrome bd ubiquinol oxidase [Coccomyxa subellipsoidea C-169]
MATKALVKVLDPFLTWAAVRYQAAVGDVLRKHGLRYEDLYDPLLNQDVDEALKRLPQEEVDARTQRLKRAMDLSLKHVYLPKELQAVQTPYNSYVMDVIEQVEAENKEKAQLGTGTTYDRSIP